MPKTWDTIRERSESTELPFAPEVFSTKAEPIPIEPPDTTSLTAMPELVLPAVISTNNDWREQPRWKPLIGTPSRTPVPADTLVPDPSPAKSCSDEQSDTLTLSSPAGSFVHRRRRGEYAERAGVSSIQALVEDTKGWHEMAPTYRNYSPMCAPVPSKHISYVNQLDRMASVMTQDPLIVNMAIDQSRGQVLRFEDYDEAILPAPPVSDGDLQSLDENLPPGADQFSSPRAKGGADFQDQTAPQDVTPSQDQAAAQQVVPSQDTTAAASVDQNVVPWLSAVPSRLNNEEYQHSIRRQLMGFYRDCRCPEGSQIMPGSVVICVAATSVLEDKRVDQFRLTFGGLYRVLQIYGDTWAFCRKLSTRDLGVPSMPPYGPEDWSQKTVFRTKKGVNYVLVAPTEEAMFLPLCAVTLWENFENYCQRAQIGPGHANNVVPEPFAPGPSTSIGSRQGSGVGFHIHKSPLDGGIVKAPPRFSSLNIAGNEFKVEGLVCVSEKIYKEYLKHLSPSNLPTLYMDSKTVREAYKDEGPLPASDTRHGNTSLNGGRANTTKGRRRLLKMRSFFRKENSEALSAQTGGRRVDSTISNASELPVPAPEPVVTTSSPLANAPLEQDHPASPVEEDHPTSAAEEDRPAFPVQEQRSTSPAQQDRPASPVQEGHPASPVQEDRPASPVRSQSAQSVMSGEMVEKAKRGGSWKKVSLATQRFGTHSREKIREYFAPPIWVIKSPHGVGHLGHIF